MRQQVQRWFVASWCLCAGVGAQAPAKTAVSATYTGCVTATPDDPNSFVLAQDGSCSLLGGKLGKKRLAGHVVVLRGLFQDATPTEPQTITVDAVSSVGPVCQETCTLEPPGHRGLRKKPKAGSPGGTPGF